MAEKKWKEKNIDKLTDANYYTEKLRLTFIPQQNRIREEEQNFKIHLAIAQSPLLSNIC